MLILANFRNAINFRFHICQNNRTNAGPLIMCWYLGQPTSKISYATCLQQEPILRPRKHERVNYFRIPASFLTTSCLLGGKHQITYKPYEFPPKQDHDHKNMKLNRPMSPHLTIYMPTLPAVTSIMQRITGISLAFYALMMSFGTLFMSNGVETYVCIVQSMNLSGSSLFIFKLIIGFPFAYHYCNGVRYALWNTGKLLNMKEVYTTAKQAVIGGLVIDFLFSML